LEIGRRIHTALELHRVTDIVASGQLREAQTIALRIEAQRFSVDRDHRSQIDSVRQIVFVQLDLHTRTFREGFEGLNASSSRSTLSAVASFFKAATLPGFTPFSISERYGCDTFAFLASAVVLRPRNSRHTRTGFSPANSRPT